MTLNPGVLLIWLGKNNTEHVTWPSWTKRRSHVEDSFHWEIGRFRARSSCFCLEVAATKRLQFAAGCFMTQELWTQKMASRQWCLCCQGLCLARLSNIEITIGYCDLHLLETWLGLPVLQTDSSLMLISFFAFFCQAVWSNPLQGQRSLQGQTCLLSSC